MPSHTDSNNTSSSLSKNLRAHSNTKVIVGMSGGVDSSVSALLLQQQGYQVEGLFMKNWDEDDGTEYCTAMTDLLDAAAVCQKLGIHLHTANFAREYWDNVFEYFLNEYKAGRTPNPDILCNREIKFKVFLEHAKVLGADYIATGHYTRRDIKDGHARLLKGCDHNKDQSYFLHAVGEAEFAQTLFPVGELEKPVVRQLAEEHDLITHNKKDSTGICFIGERRFKDFLETYLPAQPGNMVDENGIHIGTHQGLMYYTIGQRQGLGIGGVANRPDAPWFVAQKQLETNTLVVIQGKNHTLLFTDELIAEQIHWINPSLAASLFSESHSEPHNGMPSFRCHAKTRYRQPDQACIVMYNKQDETLIVTFDEGQRAITPGQSVVFYQDDVCLGGAVIQTTYKIDR